MILSYFFSTGLLVRFYLLWAEKTNKKNVRKYLAYDLQWHRWFEKWNRFSFLALFSFVEDFRSLSVDRVFFSVGMTMLTSGLLTYYETNRCNSDAFCTMSVRSFLFCPLFVRRRMVFDCPAVCGCPSFTCWAWLLPFSFLAWCSPRCFPSIWGLFCNRDDVAFWWSFYCVFYFLSFFSRFFCQTVSFCFCFLFACFFPWRKVIPRSLSPSTLTGSAFLKTMAEIIDMLGRFAAVLLSAKKCWWMQLCYFYLNSNNGIFSLFYLATFQCMLCLCDRYSYLLTFVCHLSFFFCVLWWKWIFCWFIGLFRFVFFVFCFVFNPKPWCLISISATMLIFLARFIGMGCISTAGLVATEGTEGAEHQMQNVCCISKPPSRVQRYKKEMSFFTRHFVQREDCRCRLLNIGFSVHFIFFPSISRTYNFFFFFYLPSFSGIFLLLHPPQDFSFIFPFWCFFIIKFMMPLFKCLLKRRM